MRFLALIVSALLLGCAPPTQRHLPPLPREHRAPAPGEYNPLCGGDVAVKPWAVDCIPRCLPTLRMHIACHEGLEWHYFAADGKAVTSEWIYVANGLCDIGGAVTPSYDVYHIALEDRTAEMLDGAANGTWEEDVADGAIPCTGKPDVLLVNYFAERGDRAFYIGTKLQP